jgi:uncharacterized protein YndB with AHSA1/START domain
MNDRPEIIKSIDIDATAAKVWSVFADPAISRQMGGYYDTDWKKGSVISWRGPDGKAHTRGVILQCAAPRLLQYQLFDMQDAGKVLSTIIYVFTEDQEKTLLIAREELHYEISENELADAGAGWDSALLAVKNIAEQL